MVMVVSFGEHDVSRAAIMMIIVSLAFIGKKRYCRVKVEHFFGICRRILALFLADSLKPLILNKLLYGCKNFGHYMAKET